MENLKKGDLVLLTRLSDTDQGVPMFLENVWGIFKQYTKTGKLEVLAPATRKIKEAGLWEIKWMKTRIIFAENVLAVARNEKNPHIKIETYRL